MVQGLDLPWPMFTRTFASGHEGLRKPDLGAFEHVMHEIGCDAGEMLLVDDTVENLCAAQSLGIRGILVDDAFARSGAALRNLLQDPLPRAERFMKANAQQHDSVIEGSDEVRLKDNFAQLLIWELTGDRDLVYLRGPPAGDESGLWNYFCEQPVGTTREFPADADTTAMAYLAPPPGAARPPAATVARAMAAMAAHRDEAGLVQTYLDARRPRTDPTVGCNVVRFFRRFGAGADPRLAATTAWLLDCLRHGACRHGTRHYTTPESFLYYAARLYHECGGDGPAADPALRAALAGVLGPALADRLGAPANPLALALRLAACQLAGLVPALYRRDLAALAALQQADGGWPAGHFCCYGRTRARIGNRGLTTALAIKVLRDELLA